MKTLNFLKLNSLAAVASVALAAPAHADHGKGDNSAQAAAAPARAAAHAAVVPGVAPSARLVGAPRTSSAHFTALGNRGLAAAPRNTAFAPNSAALAPLARERALQNAAAARALSARASSSDFRASRAGASRSFFAEQRRNGRFDPRSDHRDSRHDRDWWWRHHRHDRVVFIDGAWVANPFYYDFYNGYYPDYYPTYYYDEPAPVVYYGASADDSLVVDVQRELRREGYYFGTIDGVVGPGTRRAIANYQRDNGLTPTGRINNALLDSLGLT